MRSRNECVYNTKGRVVDRALKPPNIKVNIDEKETTKEMSVAIYN